MSSGVGLGTVVVKDHTWQCGQQRGPARKFSLFCSVGNPPKKNMKPAIPFILFQQSNYLNKKNL